MYSLLLNLIVHNQSIGIIRTPSRTGLSLTTTMTGSVKLGNSVWPPTDTVAATTGEPTWDIISPSSSLSAVVVESDSFAIGNSEDDS